MDPVPSKKHPGRELLALAMPGGLILLLDNLYRANDLFWVKELGREAQSALSVAGMVNILTFALYGSLGIATMSLSARAHGAGRPERARSLLHFALLLALAIGAFVAVLGTSTLDLMTDFLVPSGPGVDPARLLQEKAHLQSYLAPLFAGGVFLCLATVVEQCFLAAKDNRTPLYLQISAVGLNFVLNPLLIFGLGPIPAFGTAGAGIATVASRALIGLIGLWLLSRRLSSTVPDQDFARARTLWRMLRLGFPVLNSIAVYALVFQIILHQTFAPFGEVGRAALGVGFVLEGLAFCLIWGIGTASGSLTANALGAGSRSEAVAVVRRATRYVLILTLPLTLLFLLAPAPLAAALTEDLEVRKQTVIYLQILAWSQWAVGLQAVFDESMVAAGYSTPVSISSMFWNLVRIPLSHWLAIGQGLGLPGIWWAINLSTYGKALTGFLLLRLGRWQGTGM